MKIEHLNGEVTDTDKLPDADAEIMEKEVELREFLCKRGVPYLFVYELPVSKRFSGGHNLADAKGNSQENVKLVFGRLLHRTDGLIRWLTMGAFGIKKLDE